MTAGPAFGPGSFAFGVASIRRSTASRRSSALSPESWLMIAPFYGPKLKVARARRHIGELRAQVAAFVEKQPFELTIRQEPDFEWCRVRTREMPPEHIPTIIGDAVHNLRTALDFLACDLVHLNGRSPNGTYFPFPKTEADFDRAVKDKFRKAPSDIVAMVKALRPWEGALRELHDLDVTDKHKMILPAFSSLSGRSFWFSWTLETVEQIFGTNYPRYAADEDTAAEAELNASFKLVFPPADVGQPHAGCVEVVPTLLERAQLVDGIIQTFEAHCLGS